jgi:hypothetical protein
MITKKLIVSVICLTALTSSWNAHSDENNYTKYGDEIPANNKTTPMLTVSVSNNISEIGSNMVLSSIGGLSALNRNYELNQNIFTRLAVLYSGFFLSTLNHHINGHALRAEEFDYEIIKIDVRPFRGTIYYEYKFSRDLMQKSSVLFVSANQANLLLSQKIAWDLIDRKKDIDNATGSAYIFSSQDQVYYAYFLQKFRNELYVNSTYMQALYGKDSITFNKIKSTAFLDLLDPILFASLYSSATGKNVEIPSINIGNVGIIPSAKAILTPYGVIEKRLVTYVKTDYTPIMIAFGFGKEQKTNTPYYSDKNYKEYLNSVNEEYPEDEEYAKTINPIYAIYNYDDQNSELEKNVKNNNTYYLELKVGKIAEFGKLCIGTSLALWSQPELFTPKPRYAKIKNGGFASVDFYHNIKDNVDLFGSVGYKTKGFMIGKPVKSTPIVTVGLKLMI